MRRALLPAVLAAALMVFGCGGDDGGSGGGSTGSGSGSASSGKELFAGTCGSCHTLKDAGTSGTFGPNLGDLKPAKALVLETIANGPGAMPAKLYTGAKADKVATYVSSVAGSP
jgi:sulfite dehydrogenase